MVAECVVVAECIVEDFIAGAIVVEDSDVSVVQVVAAVIAVIAVMVVQLLLYKKKCPCIVCCRALPNWLSYLTKNRT